MANKYGKKYKKAVEGLDLKKTYSPDEAIELLKKTNTVKFDATIEFHAKLNIDLSKPEQNVRSTVVLPKGTGKTKRILAFVGDKDEKIAKDAGADFVGLEDLVEKVTKGWLGFDIAIATPEVMPKIAKVAKFLGSRGLMPNPKVGTVTTDVAKAIDEIKKGKIEFRSDSLGGIHVGIGKVSFSKEDLLENFNKFYKTLTGAKPSTIKGNFIRSAFISSTMGPGIKLDLSKIK
ncbi:MAG TPA: 50S ribosomal protein L1 [Patescibacteria group bacterium]|nr:50S ribosomal protein L1 [Patescibacteria group bacterium]